MAKSLITGTASSPSNEEFQSAWHGWQICRYSHQPPRSAKTGLQSGISTPAVRTISGWLKPIR